MNWKDALHNEPIDVDPRPGFEAQLRDDLIGEWNGRPIVSPTTPVRSTARSPRRAWLMAAAAAGVVLIGGVVIATRPDTNQTVQTPVADPNPNVTTIPGVAPTTELTTPPESDASPSTTAVIETGAPLASTTVVPTTVPPTTVPPTTVPRTTVLASVLLADWPAPSTGAG